MIGSVRGTVIERSASGEALVEVGGVGYRVLVPVSAVPSLPPGAPAFLFTHLHVREDAMVLYGFVTQIIQRFSDIPHYGELLLLNITLYNLFRTGSSTAMRSLSTGLVRKMAVPRLVLPLYGFPTRDERDTFEALIAATGVGPKLALAILSVHTPTALRRCLAEDDLAALTLVPGVGKRTAQRLLVELKSRLEELWRSGSAPWKVWS